MLENGEIVDSVNGTLRKILYARRGRELSGQFDITDTAYRDDLIAFFRACRGPFVWIENPNSAPTEWNLMMREGGLSIPRTAANLRKYTIAAIEQGPEASYLDVELNG